MGIEVMIGATSPNFDTALEALRGLLPAYADETGTLYLAGLLQCYADVMMAGKTLVVEHSPLGRGVLPDLDKINANQNGFILEALARGMN